MKILLLLPFLVGCASTAIQVEETETTCILTGALFTPTVFEQVPPETSSDYDFAYEGTNCTVHVWNVLSQ